MHTYNLSSLGIVPIYIPTSNRWKLLVSSSSLVQYVSRLLFICAHLIGEKWYLSVPYISLIMTGCGCLFTCYWLFKCPFLSFIMALIMIEFQFFLYV